MDKLYIISGNRREFIHFTTKHNLDISRVIYLYRESQLLGLSNFIYIYVGNYEFNDIYKKREFMKLYHGKEMSINSPELHDYELCRPDSINHGCLTN